MKITCHGAVGTVTGSRFLVESDTTRLLLDCGLFQGVKVLRTRNWRAPGFDPASLDAVALTHAHVDHSGYLPVLVRDGFRGVVHCTSATRNLLEILLPDAGRVAEEEARFANQGGFSRHAPALPLFTEAEAVTALTRLRASTDGEAVQVGDLTVTASRSGHILGAASVRVADARRSAVFSGDLGRPHDPLMFPPEPPPQADVLLMESTYGDRTHTAEDPVAALGAVARRTFERGGVLLVPAFAVGRAQAVLWALDQVFARGLAPRVPVYLDSPMASRVVDLYLAHPELHRLSAVEVQRLFAQVETIGSSKESLELSREREPMVIVSASGMLTGGRVLHHLRAFAPDTNSTVLLVGYQAEGTRGAALLDGARQVRIHGTEVVVRAEIARLDGLSAHADQGELLGWLASAPTPPGEVVLVHGEPRAADALRQRITRELGLPVRVADEREEVTV